MALMKYSPFKDPYFYGALLTLLTSGGITVLILYVMFFVEPSAR